MGSVGIATCAEKPELTASDRELAACLGRRGFAVRPLIWTDPGSLSAGWDLIVIRSVWDYHRHADRFTAWVSEVERASIPLINSPPIIRWNLDKAYLIELSRKGVPIVPSLLIPQAVTASAAIERIAQAGWSEIVLKPTVSATAFLTFRTLSADPNLSRKIDQIRAHSDILVQPFLPSVPEQGELSLIFFQGSERRYSHAVLKSPGAGEFRVQSDFGGSERLYAPEPSVIRFAESCLDVSPRNWVFARVDLVDWKQSPLLSELELIEPDLFLSLAPGAAEALAEAIMLKLRRG